MRRGRHGASSQERELVNASNASFIDKAHFAMVAKEVPLHTSNKNLERERERELVNASNASFIDKTHFAIVAQEVPLLVSNNT